jgi:hypothetical protein
MVIVPGAADTVVLPPRDQVPEKFKNRRLNEGIIHWHASGLFLHLENLRESQAK